MNRSQWISASLLSLTLATMLGSGALAQGHVARGVALAHSPLVTALIGVQDEEEQIALARGYIKEKKFDAAIKVLDPIIKARPDNYRLIFERGGAYFSLGKFKEADVDFTKVTTLRPMYAQGFFNRGVTRVQLKNFEGALADFSQVITLAPPVRNNVDLVAQAREQRIVAYGELKNWAKVIEDTTAILEKDPKNVTSYLNRAFALTSVNPPQNDKAIADFSAALANATTDEQKLNVYLNRADLYVKQEKFAEAAADYTAGIKLAPNDADTYGARAAVNFQLKKFAEANADYDMVIKLKPGDADVFKNRAAVRLKNQDYAGAVADYTAYLTKVPAPAEPDVFKFRAVAYLNLMPKNFTGAIADLTSYLAKKPSDAVALKDLAVAQYTSALPYDKTKATLLDGAIANAVKATTLDPKLADAFLIAGDSYSLQEKYQQAIPAYSSYIALKPEEKVGYDGRGRARYNVMPRDVAGAKADLEKLLALLPASDPGRGEVLELLANVDPNNAGDTSILDKAIEANPTSPTLRTNRGVAFFKKGDYDKAIVDFQKAVELDKTEKPEFLKNLASAYLKKSEMSKDPKDVAAATAAYEKLLAKKPGDPDALGSLADLYMATKQWDNAIAAFGKLLATNPTDPKILVAVYTNRAAARLAKMPADNAGAIADYGLIIAKPPVDPKVYNLRGLVYFEMKDYPNAILDFEKFLAASTTKDNDVVLNLASAYLLTGVDKLEKKDPTGGAAEFDKAVARYTEVLTAKPGDVKVLYSRGFAIYNKSKGQAVKADKIKTLKLAIADFEAATKAKADDADSWYYLALSYDNWGVASELDRESAFNKAIAAYEKFAAIPTVKPEDASDAKKRIEDLKKALDG